MASRANSTKCGLQGTERNDAEEIKAGTEMATTDFWQRLRPLAISLMIPEGIEIKTFAYCHPAKALLFLNLKKEQVLGALGRQG